MNDTNTSAALAAVIGEAAEMFDKGVVSREVSKYMISFCVNMACDFDLDLETVTNLISDKCSVCMKVKSREALISWDCTDQCVPEEWRRTAHNHAFGDIMVGGCVCKNCVKVLPVDMEEDEEDN